jgi:CheY-like chemotaxis protein
MTPAPLSILIVDDQPSVVAALEAVLRELLPEAELLTAGSAEEAWELIQRHRPAIVLCDIVLPGETSGLGLCQRIKATPELAPTYVILMTAFDTAEWREAALYQYRADAYLHKPFRIAELQEKLEAAFHALQSRPQPQQDIVLTASDELLQLLQANTAGDPLTGAAAALHTAPPLLPMAGRPCRRTGGAGTAAAPACGHGVPGR